jgi:hypothetical protein
MPWKFDTYTLLARICPAVLTSIPFLVMIYYLISYPGTTELVKFLSNQTFLGGITLSCAVIYAMSHINRAIGKSFEAITFTAGFPSTQFLLYSNTEFSSDFKNRFGGKVLKLGLTFPSQEEQVKDLLESKKRVSEIVKRLILELGEGKLVGSHNAAYGFIRNLCGGALIAALAAEINALLFEYSFKNSILFWFSFGLFLIYLLIYILRNFFITQFGEAYAKQLLHEFMSI